MVFYASPQANNEEFQMKKGPLSKTEKKFIDDNLSNDVGNLSKELNRSVSIIQKYIDSSAKPKTASNTYDLFARKEDRGVTVMTQEASMASDGKTVDSEATTPKRHRNAIHKIRGD